ncbi:hypothetical protein [Streptomyces sp. NPDC056683]|uniref:hypothetical protein n=1 Tax=Streptomyces sp. NPDC056683 TaxID=3345910 RepID=UPI0036AC61A6
MSGDEYGIHAQRSGNGELGFHAAGEIGRRLGCLEVVSHGGVFVREKFGTGTAGGLQISPKANDAIRE